MIPVVNFDIDQKSIHLVKILKLHETKNEKDFIDFHNILEIEQFWRVSLEHFKFSTNPLFLKCGKMDRKIDINEQNQLRRNDGAKFVGRVKVERRRRQACGCNMLHAADCYMCCFNAFFFKVKKNIFIHLTKIYDVHGGIRNS